MKWARFASMQCMYVEWHSHLQCHSLLNAYNERAYLLCVFYNALFSPFYHAYASWFECYCLSVLLCLLVRWHLVAFKESMEFFTSIWWGNCLWILFSRFNSRFHRMLVCNVNSSFIVTHTTWRRCEIMSWQRNDASAQRCSCRSLLGRNAIERDIVELAGKDGDVKEYDQRL